MSAIHYKFRSAKDYDTYRFEGAGIPVWELKNEIIDAKKLGKSDDFDLVITNAQTNLDYSDDAAIIPRNTSVVVRRVPVPKGSRPKKPQMTAYIPSSTATTIASAFSAPGVSTSGLTGTKEEDARIQRMMHESSAHWAHTSAQAAQSAALAPRRSFRPKGPTPVPPPNYTCFRCGQGGHFINHCPTNADPTFDRPRIKRTTGIPRAFLKTVDPDRLNDPSTAILVTSEGAAVIQTPNEAEWQRLSGLRTKTEAAAQRDTPEHLTCPICKDLLNSPTRVPCCGAVFCDDCICGELEGDTTLGTPPCPACRQPLQLEGLRLAGDVAVKIDDFFNGKAHAPLESTAPARAAKVTHSEPTRGQGMRGRGPPLPPAITPAIPHQQQPIAPMHFGQPRPIQLPDEDRYRPPPPPIQLPGEGRYQPPPPPPANDYRRDHEARPYERLPRSRSPDTRSSRSETRSGRSRHHKDDRSRRHRDRSLSPERDEPKRPK